MNTSETIKLFNQDQTQWNKWAKKLLDEKPEENTNEYQSWAERAKVCFDDYKFEKEANFQTFIFPHSVSFQRVTFRKQALFNDVTFSSKVNFTQAKFDEHAVFSGCIFEHNVSFAQAEFRSGSASFSEATFEKDAVFRTIDSLGAFFIEDTDFAKVPDFYQATFKAPPNFSSINIRDRLERDRKAKRQQKIASRVICTNKQLNTKELKDVYSRYRALRHFATASSDYESAQRFFAEELRAKRYCKDKWLVRTLSYCYELSSNFGRSIIRPTIGLIGLFVLSLALYWLITPPIKYEKSWQEATQIEKAKVDTKLSSIALKCKQRRLSYILYLATRNTLIVLAPDNWTETDKVATCLYGGDENSQHKTEVDIPYGIMLISIFHNFFSLLFWFLLFLGVRNNFRIQ